MDGETVMHFTNSARIALARNIAAVFLCCLALVGCESTGGPLGLTKDQQLALGRQEHPKIVAAFGGEVQDAQLSAYVDGIVRKLLAASDQPNEPITVTVLDSPIVNAMALPGYVYVTRGLLALANTEAELAGVLGHEIGHIFEQHTAERVSRSNLAGLGAAVIGILTGDQTAYQIASQGAQLYLLSFSRTQEYEADRVGVRMLANAGYNPIAEADFLNSLNRWSSLEAKIAGRPTAPPEFLSTHPNTAERVRRAAADAQVLNIKDGRNGRNTFLSAIDNMLYGDDPRVQGFVRGSTFYHPNMGFSFSVPQGMKLTNTPTSVVARSDVAQMQFAGATSQNGPGPLIAALGKELGVNLGRPRGFTVHGKQGAHGRARANTRSGQVDVQAYAIQWQGASHFIFLWVTPASNTNRLQRGIEQSVGSLRATSAASMNAPSARKIDIRTVRSGDTLSSLGALNRFVNHNTDRFVVLNGLDGSSTPQSGSRVKIVR